MISSPNNQKIKRIRRLQTKARRRREERSFVTEGVRLTEEAFSSGWEPSSVLYTSELSEQGKRLLNLFDADNTEIHQATTQVFNSVSDTQTPQGILAVFSIPDFSLPEAVDFILIADQVRDPGNLGSLIRTAAAAGVDAVLLPHGTTDPYAPKVVRSAMGAHFSIPTHIATWDEITETIHSLHVFLADPKGRIPYSKAVFSQPLAIIIGGEAEGASELSRTLANSRIHIPMSGNIESLNAAVSGSILMFDVIRQRSA